MAAYLSRILDSQNSLDNPRRPWNDVAQVLNTPQIAATTPDSHSGFFTSIGFDQWPGSGQRYKSLRAKVASRLSAVFKYLAALLNTGRLLNDQIGANTMARTKRTRARFTLSAY